MSQESPELRIAFEPRFCRNHVVDLTIGCSFGCVYCPFSDLAARREGVDRPTTVTLDRIAELAPPASVFLSPASDPFAPQAAPAAHALLEHLLPRGTVVGILTKGRLPERTLQLLAQYPAQIEGVVIGLSSLDDARNRALEPGCPPAEVRLENIRRSATLGLPTAMRLDPLFPDLDDAPDALTALVAEAARCGAWAVTATYAFAWGRYLRRLHAEPLTAASAALLTEKTPMEGGQAFGVPLERKLRTYAALAETCRAHGMRFNTCGCKDLRIQPHDGIGTVCRNTDFLDGRCGSSTPRAARPAAGT